VGRTVNRKSEKREQLEKKRSRKTKGEGETDPAWRKRRENEWEETKGRHRERDRRKDKWTAKQKGTGTWENPERGCGYTVVGTTVQGDERELCTRGRGEHGIKQPRHRIVKGKVLLLRPPTDSRLIGFKDELFGYLQKHVLKRTTTLASLYYLLRAWAAKRDVPSLLANLHW